jgi:hypothetical protein
MVRSAAKPRVSNHAERQRPPEKTCARCSEGEFAFSPLSLYSASIAT